MEEGEAPSAFFLRSENQNFKSILRVRSGTRTVDSFSSLSDLLNVHEQFYSALFPEDDIQDLLIFYISRSLAEEHRELCEGFVTLQELTDAVIMNRNKTPGPDGLTAEFYSIFWPSLGPLLVEVFNESYRDSELCESMKVSVTKG